jgi:xanthine/uracil/vitamin C permease (AzgA family)
MDAAQTSTSDLAGEGALPVELGTFAIALIVAVLFALDARRRGALSIAALCAIAGLSIFWQEFYADWGAYLLWSSKFHLMPWGSTLWTTPRKPWFLIASYPLFMCASFAAMLALTRAAIRRFPNAPRLLVCVVAAGIGLFIINLGLETAAVAVAGQWSYVDVMGPALVTAKGQQPILYPGIPFGLFGGVTCYLILQKDAQGRPLFEQLTRAGAAAPGGSRESRRVLAWIIVWNVGYWLILCMPLIAIRESFGRPNILVP